MTKMKLYRVEVEMAPAVDLFYWEKYIPEQRAFRDEVRGMLKRRFNDSVYARELHLQKIAPTRDYGDYFLVRATKRAAKSIKRKVDGVLHVKKLIK